MHAWKRLQHSSISWLQWTETAPHEGPAWLGTKCHRHNRWVAQTSLGVFHAKGGHFKHLIWVESTHMLMFRSTYIVLNTSRVLLLFIFRISHLRRDGKYDTSLVSNLLLSPTVKEFLKSANISQSYERTSSGTFYEPWCSCLLYHLSFRSEPRVIFTRFVLSTLSMRHI